MYWYTFQGAASTASGHVLSQDAASAVNVTQVARPRSSTLSLCKPLATVLTQSGVCWFLHAYTTSSESELSHLKFDPPLSRGIQTDNIACVIDRACCSYCVLRFLAPL